MNLTDQIKKQLGDTKLVQTTDGYDNTPQGNLPGDRTLVIHTSSFLKSNTQSYFEIDNGAVVLPNAWKEDSNLSPSESQEAAVINMITRQTELNITYRPVFKQADGSYLYED